MVATRRSSARMRSRSPSPAQQGQPILAKTDGSGAEMRRAAAARRRMLCVVVAGVACSTSSVITDEIVDLYAMEELQLSAESWGRVASLGNSTVSVGLLVVAVVVGRVGTRLLGSASLAALGAVLTCLCLARLTPFVLLLGLSLVCRDAAYVCTNSLTQTVHRDPAGGDAGVPPSLLHTANMWYRIATGSAAIVVPVAVTQATTALRAAGSSQPYGLVVGVAGVGITLAGGLLCAFPTPPVHVSPAHRRSLRPAMGAGTYPPSVGTEPQEVTRSAAGGVSGGAASSLLAEARQCWQLFSAPFYERPGLLRFVAITTTYEAFSFMGAMQFGVYRLQSDLGMSVVDFGWLCSLSAVCGLGAIAVVARLSSAAGVQPALVGIYASQSLMLGVIGLSDSYEISVAAFFFWRVLDRARWAPYSVWTSLLTGGGANDKTAMFAMQKVLRAAPSAAVQFVVLVPVAGAMGLQAVFALSALCSLAASILLMRLPPPSEG